MRSGTLKYMMRQAPGASQAATGESRAPGRPGRAGPGMPPVLVPVPQHPSVPAPQAFRRSERLTDPRQLPALDGHDIEAALGPATAGKA